MGRALGLRDPGPQEPLRHRSRQRATPRGDPGYRSDPKSSRPFAGTTGSLVQRWLASLPPKAIRRAYRRAVKTGRRGRPPLRLPEGLSLTQTIKHRDEHGRLLSVETRATIGTAAVEQPVPVHTERLNGVLRDRLACLTRKTHAFAKSTLTWDALFRLALFEHNWLRTHPALGQPSSVPGRCYDRRTPAMAIGLTDHRWSWREFLTTKATVSS
jgi:hypothetical protein